MQEDCIDTVIISDLHLGSEISRGGDALKFLQSIRFKRLILLGDIFCDLNFRRLTKEQWKFLGHIRKLSNPRHEIDVVWVEGNHDHGLTEVMSHLVGVPVYQQYVWEYEGKRHLAINGQVAFPLILPYVLLVDRYAQQVRHYFREPVIVVAFHPHHFNLMPWVGELPDVSQKLPMLFSEPAEVQVTEDVA